MRSRSSVSLGSSNHEVTGTWGEGGRGRGGGGEGGQVVRGMYGQLSPIHVALCMNTLPQIKKFSFNDFVFVYCRIIAVTMKSC